MQPLHATKLHRVTASLRTSKYHKSISIENVALLHKGRILEYYRVTNVSRNHNNFGKSINMTVMYTFWFLYGPSHCAAKSNPTVVESLAAPPASPVSCRLTESL